MSSPSRPKGGYSSFPPYAQSTTQEARTDTAALETPTPEWRSSSSAVPSPTDTQTQAPTPPPRPGSTTQLASPALTVAAHELSVYESASSHGEPIPLGIAALFDHYRKHFTPAVDLLANLEVRAE